MKKVFHLILLVALTISAANAQIRFKDDKCGYVSQRYLIDSTKSQPVLVSILEARNGRVGVDSLVIVRDTVGFINELVAAASSGFKYMKKLQEEKQLYSNLVDCFTRAGNVAPGKRIQFMDALCEFDRMQAEKEKERGTGLRIGSSPCD